jgi:small conductance mechanosensitive channel
MEDKGIAWIELHFPEMNLFWSQIAEMMGTKEITAMLISFLPSFLSAIIVFLLFWFFWRLIRRGLRFTAQRAQLDRTAVNFILTVLKYTLLTIGLVAALGKVGINTSSLLTSLGVAGLTVGFAAKDVLSNMISGLFIFWDRPFVLGDLVEVGGHYGRVERITMRSTRVVTPDGRMLAVPNTVVVNTTVASYTNFPIYALISRLQWLWMRT